jgi:hypothetical protein
VRTTQGSNPRRADQGPEAGLLLTRLPACALPSSGRRRPNPNLTLTSPWTALSEHYGFDGYLINLEAPVRGGVSRDCAHPNPNPHPHPKPHPHPHPHPHPNPNPKPNQVRGGVSRLRELLELLTLCLKQRVGPQACAICYMLHATCYMLLRMCMHMHMHTHTHMHMHMHMHMHNGTCICTCDMRYSRVCRPSGALPTVRLARRPRQRALPERAHALQRLPLRRMRRALHELLVGWRGARVLRFARRASGAGRA